MSIKVRPSAEWIEGKRPRITIELRAFIRGGAFVVAVLDRELEVRARAIDSDDAMPTRSSKRSRAREYNGPAAAIGERVLDHDGNVNGRGTLG